MCVCVCVCALTEAGGIGCRVDLQSGAADDQICGQFVSFICGHHHVLVSHIQLQLWQVGHFLTWNTQQIYEGQSEPGLTHTPVCRWKCFILSSSSTPFSSSTSLACCLTLGSSSGSASAIPEWIRTTWQEKSYNQCQKPLHNIVPAWQVKGQTSQRFSDLVRVQSVVTFLAGYLVWISAAISTPVVPPPTTKTESAAWICTHTHSNELALCRSLIVCPVLIPVWQSHHTSGWRFDTTLPCWTCREMVHQSQCTGWGGSTGSPADHIFITLGNKDFRHQFHLWVHWAEGCG